MDKLATLKPLHPEIASSDRLGADPRWLEVAP